MECAPLLPLHYFHPFQIPLSGNSRRAEEYKYRVKVIPKQKKDFRVISWHGVNEMFKSPIELKKKLLSTLSEHLPSSSEIDSFELGYLEGRRQTKRWIISEKDLFEMYENAPSDDREILLWCDGKDVSRKRKGTDDDAAEKPAPKRSGFTSSAHENDIEALTEELTSIHGDKYSYAQYKLWARMIINKQHKDKDTPPNIPMIMGKPDKKEKKDFSESMAECAVAIVKALQAPAVPATQATLTCPQPVPDGISPSKKVSLRSQYLSQLKTLQNLRDDGVLTQDEFQAEKDIVLSSLKALK